MSRIIVKSGDSPVDAALLVSMIMAQVMGARRRGNPSTPLAALVAQTPAPFNKTKENARRARQLARRAERRRDE